MKALLCAIIFAALCIAACTKTDVQPPQQVSANTSDNLSIVKTRSSYLVSNKWVYNALYFNYIDQQHKGDPQYIRGASNNILDLDKTIYSFKDDGTFVELDGGYKYPGTWKFTDKTASLLVLDYTYWTDNDSILVMSNKLCNYTQPIGYHHKSYTEWKTTK